MITSGEREQLRNAQTFEYLASVALQILERVDRPIGIVCGPITTGGAGSVAKNLERFSNTIDRLQRQGVNIFSQMPFEDAMARIKTTNYYRGGQHLLEAFYLPIFESGRIDTFYFLPDWKSSQGATWEHEQATRLGKEIVYL